MSSASTSTRARRGVPVPGIVTKQQSWYANGWPLTPQSASELRGSSLAYSGLSDASHSEPSSISGHSQPATPAYSMGSPHDYTHWSEDGKVQGSPMFTGLADECSVGLLLPTMFNQPVAHQPVYITNGMGGVGQRPPMRQSPQQDGFTAVSGLPMQDFWTGSQQTSMGFNNVDPVLKTMLLHDNHGMEQETAMLNDRNTHGMPTTLHNSPFGDYDTTTSSQQGIYQPNQVIVPSQVDPNEDYTMGQYSACGQHEASDGCSQGFDSAVVGHSSWESVSPSSPMEAYFTSSDDDAYMEFNNEMAAIPPRNSNLGSCGTFETDLSQPRSRRRPSKRARRSHTQGEAWFEAEHHNVTVRYEGPRFSLVKNSSSLDDKEFSVIADRAKDPKPHKCMAKKADGSVCGVSFERSEHLKRHMGSHNGERTYMCPVPDCKKRREGIGRPDNACDHFKTHLRPPAKGKRNKTCSWEFLERHLRDVYPEKVANKMLTNLRKWYVTEAEKTMRAKRAAQLAQQFGADDFGSR